MTTRTYLTEFPDFDRTEIAEQLLAAGWTDSSWHNDTCPSFTKGRAILFVDYADPALQELPSSLDFTILELEPNGEGYTSDEGDHFVTLDEALAFSATIKGEVA